MRFLPPAISSKILSTALKLFSSLMTPLLSQPGRTNSSTAGSRCIAAMKSSLEMDPSPSESMRLKITRVALVFGVFSALAWRKCAAKSARVTRCLPPAMASKIASTASKLCSSLIKPLLSSPGSTKSFTVRSPCMAAMKSSFDTTPSPSESTRSKMVDASQSSSSSSSACLAARKSSLSLKRTPPGAARESWPPCRLGAMRFRVPPGGVCGLGGLGGRTARAGSIGLG
mmetsp:Transcript_71792/g.153473  ORF Transcript_71792/g.153473 Transcript_71792/m.153473 type:complete len:228 (+) Transcript_71792:1749-2432(+)